MKRLSLVTYLSVLFAVATLVSITGRPAETVVTAADQSMSAATAIPDLSGTWTGSWFDTVFTVGPYDMTFVLTQDAGSVSGTGTIDFSAFGFGVVNGTCSGTISGNVLTGTFTAGSGPSMGSGSLTLTGMTMSRGITNATASGSGSNFFGPFVIEGTVTDTQITGTFGFTNPGSGGGTGTMIKQSSPIREETLGKVKAEFAD